MEKVKMVKQTEYILLRCPMCLNSFKLAGGPGVHGSVTYQTECPQCQTPLFFQPVFFCDITHEKLNLAMSAFLENQTIVTHEKRNLHDLMNIQREKEKGGDD